MMHNLPKTWNICPLNKCAKVFFSNVDKKTSKNELPVYLCNYMDVYKNEKITSNISFMEATAKQIEIDKFRLRKGDVIITKDSETPDDIAIPAFVSEDFENVICGYHLALIRPDTDILLGEFLTKLIQLKFYKHYFLTLANGVTRYGITGQAVKKAKVILPTLPEQKKISQIISAWDSVIELLEKLVDLKKKRKKGLMRQLLTGKRRFKDFSSEPWKEYKYGDFLKYTPREIPKPDETYKALGIRSHGKGTFHKIVDNPETVGMDTLYLVKKNDLIVNITFAWEGAIAVAVDEDENRLVSHRFPTYEFDDKICIPDYFKQIILTKEVVYRLALVSPGGAGRNRVLSKKDFLKTKMFLPPINEQIKISTFFSELDLEIKSTETYLDLMKRQKKGLMQQLLTGKKRVKVEE